nr:putative ORF1 [Marmot picobirnavirus]
MAGERNDATRNAETKRHNQATERLDSQRVQAQNALDSQRTAQLARENEFFDKYPSVFTEKQLAELRKGGGPVVNDILNLLGRLETFTTTSEGDLFTSIKDAANKILSEQAPASYSTRSSKLASNYTKSRDKHLSKAERFKAYLEELVDKMSFPTY